MTRSVGVVVDLFVSSSLSIITRLVDGTVVRVGCFANLAFLAIVEFSIFIGGKQVCFYSCERCLDFV